MSAPTWTPVDEQTASLLDLLADDGSVSPSKDEVRALFLQACRLDAKNHGGLVSVNRVRAMLAPEQIPPRTYSALWSHFTGRGKPMEKARLADGSVMWQTCHGSTSGNDGRPFPLRRWVG